MKRILAIGTFFVLVSCSSTEESINEDQGCFQTEQRIINGLW